jgi:spore coat protein U-like protein
MRKIAFGIAAVAAVSATPALAQASNSLPVEVNVINSCTVSASPLNFGSPTAIGTANIDRTSNVALVCTNGAAYTVSMDAGLHVAGTQRRMSNGAGTPVFVPYGIYRDAGYTAEWTTGLNSVSGVAGSSGLVSLTAYGRIPSTAASVVAGRYTDTVTVSVTF